MPASADPAAPAVEVRGVTKRYAGAHGSVLALNDVSLVIRPAERLVLLGPSGCGKTTLLRCIAGLETPDEGEILIGGTTVFSARRGIALPPERRGISMVFQSYALWPHMTAAENIAYPLQNRFVRKVDVASRVEMVLRMVGCDGLDRRHPSQLSGGQQQRIALARAIVSGDPLILFDEPLSNVDAKVRERLRIELIGLQKRLGFAAVYVTHDQIEAAAIAHRMAVMAAGTVAQTGTPREIYEDPASSYVAEFTGTTNELAGEVVQQTRDGTVVSTPIGNLLSSNIMHFAVGQKVKVLLRPECIQLATGPADVNAWRARVESRMFLGSQTEYALGSPGGYMLVRDTETEQFEEDAEVWASIPSLKVKLFAVQDP